MIKEEKKAYRKAYYEANKDKIKAYYQANKDKAKAKAKAYYEANKKSNKEKRISKAKAYYEANKKKINARNKAWRESNKDKIIAYKKSYYQANKDKAKASSNVNCKAYQKAYREANKEKMKSYRKSNKEKINAQRNAIRNAKRKTDHLFKLKCNLRSRTYLAFKSKGYKKESKTAKTLGASYKIVSKHLERQFTDGMNWENYGDWHVDHIIPLASAKTKAELIKLCHFRNLQPLWAADNLSKGCRIE